MSLRHIAECRIAKLKRHLSQPSQQDNGSPACMITGLPGLCKRCTFFAHAASMLLCYTHSGTYIHDTRLPYEICISCHKWFHKACQDIIDSVFKGESNFGYFMLNSLFKQKNVHVKSTLSYKLQYHLSLRQYHLVGRFIWPSSAFYYKEPSTCIRIGTCTYRVTQQCICARN